MTKFTRQQYSAFAAILIASFAATGCTQIREAKFPEGAGENIFERTLFTSSAMSLATDAAPKRIQKHSRKVRASEQSESVTVREVAAPEAIRSMFKSLEIAAAGEKQYALKFRLDRQFLTSYRVVKSAEELSIQDLQLAAKVSESEYWVPLFQYRIQAYGQVVRAKNDLGEDTSTLRLKPSEWKDATHIQVSTLPEDRVAVATSSPDDAERVFVRGKLDGSVFSREELASELDIRVDRAGQFETVIDGGEMVLQELVSSKVNQSPPPSVSSWLPRIAALRLRPRSPAAPRRSSPACSLPCRTACAWRATAFRSPMSKLVAAKWMPMALSRPKSSFVRSPARMSRGSCRLPRIRWLPKWA